MRRAIAILCAATALAAAGQHFSAVETGVSAQQKMKTFQLVLLKKGSVPLEPKVRDEHGRHMMKLGADGVSIAAGPFTDGGDFIGAMILRAATVEQATQIEAEDPAVKAGMFTTEVLTFMSTDEGQFQRWATPFAQETVYFGFLNSGPNRSQDKEEAARLQKEHIAYMDEQWKLGKLLVAGPFVDGGIHRGLVIYRAGSPEEAKERSQGDPMVKLGRLTVDLRPWMIPKGALK